MVPSLPAASSACSTTSTPHVSWAARRSWYSDSIVTPSSSSATPAFLFLIPALKPGSKSFESLTFDPGSTRNGAMNSSSRFRRVLVRGGTGVWRVSWVDLCLLRRGLLGRLEGVLQLLGVLVR